MTDTTQKFFSNLTLFLNTNIAPLNNVLDQDEHLLKYVFRQFIELDSLKLLIPLEYGGLGGDRPEWIEYNIQMAQYSGALLFLQAQHQFAIKQLKQLMPNQKIQVILKQIAKSNRGLGICLAANRHLLDVKPFDNGYSVSGQLRWVTGFNYLSSILLSFDIDQMVHYAIFPFQSDLKNKHVSISPRIETSVFNSTNTVSITLNKLFITEDEIIATHPSKIKAPMEHPVVYNFAGAAKALLEIAMQSKYQDHPQVKLKSTVLLNEWSNYYAKLIASHSCPLKLRAQGLLLAERCASFARVVCGAEGLLASHPITRINREIWQYAIAGYTENQLEAYLDNV